MSSGSESSSRHPDEEERPQLVQSGSQGENESSGAAVVVREDQPEGGNPPQQEGSTENGSRRIGAPIAGKPSDEQSETAEKEVTSFFRLGIGLLMIQAISVVVFNIFAWQVESIGVEFPYFFIWQPWLMTTIWKTSLATKKHAAFSIAPPLAWAWSA